MFLVARAPFLFGPALAFGLVIAAASGVGPSDEMFSISSEVMTSTMGFRYFLEKSSVAPWPFASSALRPLL